MPFRLLSSTNSTPPFFGTVTAPFQAVLPDRWSRSGRSTAWRRPTTLRVPWVLSTTLPSGRVPPLTVTGSPNTRALPFFTTSWLSVKATRPPASANTGSAGSTCSALRAKWYSPFTREASILARGSTSCRSRLPTPSTRKGSVKWLMLAATGLSAMKRRKSWVGPLAVPRTVSTSLDSKSGSTAVTSSARRRRCARGWP
jgi:hypothetical protein